MTAEHIAQSLGGATRSGNGWMCFCPCHDDKKPSLSIADGNKGQPIINCFAGCWPEDVIKALKSRDLWPQPERNPTSRHEYTDDEGIVSFEVCRYADAPKALTRHWGGRDWIWNAKGCARYLYRLPKVVRAKTVYVCEGEKDADALAKLGFCTTTNPFGATARWLPQYTESLKGKNVRLLPDNDKVGKDHMNTVAHLLTKAGISCKVIELPGLAEKGDVRDWLNAGGTKEKLIALVKETPRYESRWKDDPANKAVVKAAGEPSKLVTERASDITIKPVSWLWPGRIPRGKITLVAGDPSLAKSTITVSWTAVLTASVSAKENWRLRRFWPDGLRRVGGPSNVIVLSAEDDSADTICPRLLAAGADLERVHIVKSVLVGATGAGSVERMFSLQADLRDLEKKIEEVGSVSMVVIDPVSAYMDNVDSYKNTEVRHLMAPLAQLAQKHNIAVVLITHLNKNQEKDWKSVSGSIAMVALARVAYLAIEDANDEDSDVKRKLLFCVKNNIAELPPALAYNTLPVTISSKEGPIKVTRIDWDEDEIEMTLEEAVRAMKQRGSEASPKQQQVIDLLSIESNLTAAEIVERLGWPEEKNHYVFFGRMVARKQLVKKGLRYSAKT